MLTLGGRESLDRKSFIGGQQDLNDFFYKISGCYPYDASASLIGAPASLTCQQALGFPNPATVVESIHPRGRFGIFNVFTPTVGVQYHFDPDLMACFSYAKGFKTGGWTTRLTGGLRADGRRSPSGRRPSQSYEWD